MDEKNYTDEPRKINVIKTKKVLKAYFSHFYIESSDRVVAIPLYSRYITGEELDTQLYYKLLDDNLSDEEVTIETNFPVNKESSDIDYKFIADHIDIPKFIQDMQSFASWILDALIYMDEESESEGRKIPSVYLTPILALVTLYRYIIDVYRGWTLPELKAMNCDAFSLEANWVKMLGKYCMDSIVIEEREYYRFYLYDEGRYLKDEYN